MALFNAAKRYLKTVGRAVGTATVGLSSPDGRRDMRDLSNFLAGSADGGAGGDAPLTGAQPLRMIDLDDFWPNDRAICLSELRATSHNVTERELITLCALAASTEGGRFFEFGTFDGRTGVNLLRNNARAELHTLDLPPEEMISGTRDEARGRPGIRLREATDLQGRYTFISSRSDQYDYREFEDSMDFVFVDAGHGYDAVKHDSSAAAGMLRDGGIIAWHDYGHLRGCEPFPGLTRAVDEFFARGNAPGVGVTIRGTRIAACLPEQLL
ncbi:MAG: class I SAM-dependent methyltransferase [Planctomycetota bacterium]